MARKNDTERQERFLRIADEYKNVIAKVCSLYATPAMSFSDLYQEVMINLWTGLDSFRGDAKVSTWIYRLALNTCITVHRTDLRHNITAIPIESAFDIPETGDNRVEELRRLYALISRLDAIDRALVLLWLDEKSYDEISTVMGISKANVATRLFRARRQLAQMAHDTDDK